MGVPLLVLGVGNVLMSDDGLGVHVVRALQDGAGLPPGTSVVDGGTAGLSLLPLLADAAAVVMVDAVDLGAVAGSVHVLTGAALEAGASHLSAHQAAVADLLTVARLTGVRSDDVVLVGVQPASIGPGLRLSPAVRAALPKAIAAVRAHALEAAAAAGGAAERAVAIHSLRGPDLPGERAGQSRQA